MKKKVFISIIILVIMILIVGGYLLYPLTYKGSDKIVLIEKDNFESLNDITQLNYFKDKLVYVDIWGTYCTPCLREFEYSDTLKKKFDGKPLEFLYLCLGHRIDHKVRWRQIINDRDLKGYHVLLNADLYMDIWEDLEIDKKKKYMIPHYFIVENGEILVHDAHRSSAKVKLYKQLDDVLKLK